MVFTTADTISSSLEEEVEVEEVKVETGAGLEAVKLEPELLLLPPTAEATTELI